MNDSQLDAFAGSMDLLKKIHEATQDVYWVIDKNGRFVYVSPSVYQQRGFTSEEVMARPALESICEEDRARAAETFSLGLEMIDRGLTRLPAGRASRTRTAAASGPKSSVNSFSTKSANSNSSSA